jgi:hypothetical protein
VAKLFLFPLVAQTLPFPACGSNSSFSRLWFKSPPYYEKYIEKYIFIGYNLLGRSSGIENL